jgi:hypothetical protein
MLLILSKVSENLYSAHLSTDRRIIMSNITAAFR